MAKRIIKDAKTGAVRVEEYTPAPEVYEPRDLSPPQFEYLLSLTGFDEVWDKIAADAKAAGDRATYAALMAERKRSRFRLDVVLAVVARFADQVPPDVDLSEATIRAAWKDAEKFGGLA